MSVPDQLSSTDELSLDDIFSMLSNGRRRLTLDYLRDHGGPAGIRDLSEAIAAAENHVPVEELTYQQRKRVYISLHQTHLPKLDDVGFVEYDRNRGTITLRDRADALNGFLWPEEEEVKGRQENREYLVLTGVGAVVVAAAWVDLYPFTLVPDLAYAGLFVLALATIQVAHAYADTNRE